MLTICKSYTFCYAHRIWSQTLSNHQRCKCVQIHGHSAKLDVVLISDELRNGMVVDFNELKVIKEFIDSNIDHKFLIDLEDPLLRSWLEKYGMGLDNLNPCGGYFSVSDTQQLNKWDQEFLNSLVIVPFVPSSENLVLWISGLIRSIIKELNEKIGLAVKLYKVRWWESESSFAEWEG